MKRTKVFKWSTSGINKEVVRVLVGKDVFVNKSLLISNIRKWAEVEKNMYPSKDWGIMIRKTDLLQYLNNLEK